MDGILGWDGTGGSGNVRSAGLDWSVIRRGVPTSILWDWGDAAGCWGSEGGGV